MVHNLHEFTELVDESVPKMDLMDEFVKNWFSDLNGLNYWVQKHYMSC